MNAEHVLNVQCQLGEGPIWNVERQMLYWVDIKRSRLHRYDPATGGTSQLDLSTPLMAVAFRARGGLITLSGHGFSYFDEESGRFEPLGDPEADKPQTRFNDGAVDPTGRFWGGTMNEADFDSPVNGLYRLEPDGAIHPVLNDLTLANGIGWSPDAKTMYVTDTGKRQILAFDYDAPTGGITNRRIFAAIPEAEGYPDGMAVDAEGGVWSAIWAGAKVVRFDAAGQRLQEITLPVTQVSSCAFGGPDLTDLYITTAHHGLTDEQRRAEPLAGDLFRARVGVPGQPAYQFMG